MTYPRPAALALVALAVGLSACTSTVDGAPSFGGDVPSGGPSESPSRIPSGPTGGGIEVPSSGASRLPSSPGQSASSGLPTTSSGVPSGVPSASATVPSPSGSAPAPNSGLCAVISPEELEQIFGGPATTEAAEETSCTYVSTRQGSSVTVSYFDSLNIKDQLEIIGPGKRTTLFGHPASLAASGVTVTIGNSYTSPGIVTAFGQPEVRQVSIKLLEKVFPEFSND